VIADVEPTIVILARSSRARIVGRWSSGSFAYSWLSLAAASCGASRARTNVRRARPSPTAGTSSSAIASRSLSIRLWTPLAMIELVRASAEMLSPGIWSSSTFTCFPF
jgi:hypothetical protein